MRIVFIITALIVFVCCKKQEDQNTNTCADRPVERINPALYDAKFKVGTYWVYLDSMTLQIDTIKIASILSDGLEGNSRCSNQKHEYYAFKVDRAYSGAGDIFSIRGNGIMLNQSEELGNNYIYRTNSTIIDSMFIYDRYYKSVVKTTRNNVTVYYNLSYGLLKIDNYYGKRFLKDKFIVR